MMMTSSKCRPRKSAGRFWVTVSPYQITYARLQQIPFYNALTARSTLHACRNACSVRETQQMECVVRPHGRHRCHGREKRRETHAQGGRYTSFEAGFVCDLQLLQQSLFS